MLAGIARKLASRAAATRRRGAPRFHSTRDGPAG